MISLLEKVGGYEPSIPRMCSPDKMTLRPRTNGVCMHRVVRADQIPLTDKRPHLEQPWKVPGLNDGQADMVPVAEVPTNRNSTNTETLLVKALQKSPKVRALKTLSIFHAYRTCMGWLGSFLRHYHRMNRYLVFYCQKIVVCPEGSHADRIKLGFGRLVISWDRGIV